MPNIRIIPMKNGPNMVRTADADEVEILGPNGEALPHKASMALCRCGGSKTKPFCDGTHAKIGFQAPGMEKAPTS